MPFLSHEWNEQLTAIRNEMGINFGVNSIGSLAILYKVNIKFCNAGADNVGSLMHWISLPLGEGQFLRTVIFWSAVYASVLSSVTRVHYTYTLSVQHFRHMGIIKSLHEAWWNVILLIAWRAFTVQKWLPRTWSKSAPIKFRHNCK